MLLSVFTPTNNPAYLTEAFRSLRLQAYRDWEWVIAPNGDAVGQIPEGITRHPQVRIRPYEGPARIGALKHYCCQHAAGDVFIELDHDDMLVPGVLQRIADAAAEGAGFIFSDVACFSEARGELVPVSYSEDYGWESYEFRVYEHELRASRAFDVSARSLSEIFYAPDHVRCWTRQAYEQVGGHNPDLEVGDDHELMIRTYLAGFPFQHTGTCGYLYRMHPGNTVKSHNDKIQRQQAANRDTYLYPLIDEWTRRQSLAYLDINRDSPHLAGEMLQGVEDSSVGAIRAYDTLPWLTPERAQAFINACWRVLAPGGWLCLRAPSTTGKGAYLPCYRSWWNDLSFRCWSRDEYASLMPPGTARYQLARCFTQELQEQVPVPGVPYVFADLCALKGQRQPGRVWV